MWEKVLRFYKESMPFLMLILTALTVYIGWNQYKLSERQKIYEIKKMHLARAYESAKEINNDVAQIGQLGRELLRKSLELKRAIEQNNKIQQKDLLLTTDFKVSLTNFYTKWDSINTKISSNQLNLTNFLSDIYQKFTYSVAFDRRGNYNDPWNNNYELEITNFETGEKLKVNIDDRMILPYGESFSLGQHLHDSPSYNPDFKSKSDFVSFLDHCQDLGSYTFDIHEDLLEKVSNYLIRVSLSESMIGN